MSNPILTIRSLVPSVEIIRNGNMEKENWMIRPTKRAIQDLLTLIDHVQKIVDDPFADEIGIVEWLVKVRRIFREAITSIDRNHLQIGVATAKDNEELDVIEDLLDNAWSLSHHKVNSVMNRNPKSLGMDLLRYLIEFWVEEIKSRGWVIHGLLNGSVTSDEIQSAFSHIDKVDYPPIY